MTLENINYIAQTTGVIAIFASLIFLGIQVRQNSAITRAQVHQQISDAFTVYLETMANHSAVVFAGTSSKEGMASLTDEELLRFSFIKAGLFKIWENAFYQYKSGFLDEAHLAIQRHLDADLVSHAGRANLVGRPKGSVRRGVSGLP